MRWPGVATGRVWPGANAAARRGGVGDALSMDLATGLFGVADGPERSPGAACRFLARISSRVRAAVLGQRGGLTWAERRERVVAAAEEALRATPRDESCAFTGVWMVAEKGASRAVLLHAGDTFLRTWNVARGTLKEVTRGNFWMVGRTSRFFQLEEVALDPEVLLLLGTDGFVERFLARPIDPEALERGKGGDAPLDLEWANAPARRDADDAAVIVLCPHRVGVADGAVVLGGPESGAGELPSRERLIERTPEP